MPRAHISTLTVFCGSRTGNDPSLETLTANLGNMLAEKQIRLVYGGGSIGLMGILARAQMKAGGHVTGIIPDFLDALEVGERNITDFVRVTSMHERKALMAEEADAFLVLPGGIGTLDELVEILTWRQLALHEKPVFLLDHAGYWQPFVTLLEHIYDRGFIGPETLTHIEVLPDLAALMHKV
ncbi:MAG: TIGR00730 family Rossman fold protein [Alphaproteobacteria bacterium]